MTDQAKIESLHERVTAWSDQYKEKHGEDYSKLTEDEGFAELVNELMTEDEDTLFTLLGKAIAESPQLAPAWLTEGLLGEDDPS